MNGSLQLKDRGIQILTLLKQNGPISFRGLKSMIEPPVKDRRLHSSLARLIKNRLVSKRQERVFRGAGVFYQLAQESGSRERAASVLGCTSKELHQPFFVSRELLHSEACALWANKLRTFFPDAKIIRDFQFYNDESVHEIMLTNKDDHQLLPDLLMVMNGKSGQSKVFVAFEIERSRKSKFRLLEKLRKYADETALDGVVYICESSEVSEPVSQIYKTKVGDKSLRIGHYGDYFLLLSNELVVSNLGRLKMFNAKKEYVSLQDWINQMGNTRFASRRNNNFEVGAVSCSHSEKIG